MREYDSTRITTMRKKLLPFRDGEEELDDRRA